MARLKRRGIGMVNIERTLNREEYLKQSAEGLGQAYERLWMESKQLAGDVGNSFFWALMLKSQSALLRPVVHECSAAMDRCLLSSIMYWNAGMISASELSRNAFDSFEKWFRQELLPRFDEHCTTLDAKILQELDGYVCSAMEQDGVHPVHLQSFSTAEFTDAFRLRMEELIPELVRSRISASVPDAVRDSRLAFIRRRRLRRAVAQFFKMQEAEGDERRSFIVDELVDVDFVIDHANAVLSALAKSMNDEQARLLDG